MTLNNRQTKRTHLFCETPLYEQSHLKKTKNKTDNLHFTTM